MLVSCDRLQRHGKHLHTLATVFPLSSLPPGPFPKLVFRAAPAAGTRENKFPQSKDLNPRHLCALHSKQALPCHLKLRTKSQATEQKTKLFSAVTLLNLIFPMSSFSFSSRMKCIFVLCHKTLDFVKAIHFSVVICKCTPHHTRAGEFYGFLQRQGK